MSTGTHAGVTPDGRKIQRIIDELWELEETLQDIQAECARKREKGRIKDHKKERARTGWIAEERKTAKERRQLLEAIAAYQAGEKLDKLEAQLE